MPKLPMLTALAFASAAAFSPSVAATPPSVAQASSVQRAPPPVLKKSGLVKAAAVVGLTAASLNTPAAQALVSGPQARLIFGGTALAVSPGLFNLFKNTRSAGAWNQLHGLEKHLGDGRRVRGLPL